MDERFKEKYTQFDAYFATRNGIDVTKNLQPGINYTAQTLFYMTPPKRADKIATDICKLYGDSQFIVIEICSGIGGNTLAFASNPQIAAVISYEVDPDRRLMLKRNIKLYGDEMSCKVAVPDEGFQNPDLTQFAGCALYFDPPWLPTNIDPSTSTQADYLLSGIKIGGFSIEEILENYIGIAYSFEAQLPPNYQLENVEGWDIEVEHIYQHKSTAKRNESQKGSDVRITIFRGICPASVVHLKKINLELCKDPFLASWTEPNLNTEEVDFVLPNIDHSELFDGYNYTYPSIVTSVTTINADKITESIKKRYAKNPFLLLQIGANIGAQTLSFLKESQIGLVIVAEPSYDKRLMLKRNIMAYTDTFSCKCIVEDNINNLQSETINIFKGCCLYFDAPWCMDEKYCSSEKYLTSGITIGGKTIEEWLEDFNGIAYTFSGRFPLGYQLEKVDGWKFKIEETPDARIWHGQCEDAKSYVGAKNGNVGGLLSYLPKLSKGECVDDSVINWEDPFPLKKYEKEKKSRSPQKILKEDEDEDEIDKDEIETNFENINSEEIPPMKNFAWKNFCKSIPSRTVNKNSPQWLIEYQRYLSILLSPIITPTSLLLKFLTPEYMPLWVQSVTHITFDARVNYESLEIDGDALLGWIFKLYLRQRFPNISEQGLSEYKSRYMSKENQKIFSRQMKLNEWILADDEIDTNNDSICEDVFESFIGVLSVIANRISISTQKIPSTGIPFGFGAECCFNIIPLIFNEITFDKKWILGKPITILQQRGGMIKLGVGGGIIESKNTESNGSTTITLNFEPKALEKILSYKKILYNPIATANAFGSKAANAKAWDIALTYCENAGYTHEWALDIRDKRMFDNIDVELVKRAKDKARLENLHYLEFNQPKNIHTKNNIIIQLLGHDMGSGIESNKIRSLAVSKGNTELNAKIAVLKKYLGE